MEGEQSAVQALQLDTQLGEVRPADQRELSPRGRSRAIRRPRERMVFSSQPRYASPERTFCDGCCGFSEEPHPIVVSIGRPLLRDSGLMFVDSSLSLPARTCNAHGKGRKAH